MTGYTKLFASILDSTIWREEDKTRLVWITMLAMSNQWGDVEASIPGLADRAHVSVAEAEKAVEVLSAPDKYSRTKDHEGRRIEEIDGGWRILNHAKYRDKMSQDERREYFRKKQQERRDRLKSQQPVNKCQTLSKTVKGCSAASTPSTHTEADSEAKADAAAPLPKTPPAVGVSKPLYSAAFEEFWKAYPRKESKGDAWKAFLKLKAHPEVTLEVLLAAVQRQKASDGWRKDAGRFIPHPATWLNSRRWEDESTPSLSTADAGQEWLDGQQEQFARLGKPKGAP